MFVYTITDVISIVSFGIIVVGIIGVVVWFKIAEIIEKKQKEKIQKMLDDLHNDRNGG